jgi:hypothetical protein
MQSLRAQGRLSWRQGILLAIVVLGCIQNSRCMFEYFEPEAVSLQADDQFTPAAAAAAAAAATVEAHGRSLLQNPDRPDLTKYGGVNMTGEVMQGCAHKPADNGSLPGVADTAADVCCTTAMISYPRHVSHK